MLLTDGIGNVLLGLAMLLFPGTILKVLGFSTNGASLLSIFGSVILGIGLALVVQTRRLRGPFCGLGLTGAMLINLCFGLAIGYWLIWGNLEPNPVGSVLLWALTAILLIFGVVELSIIRRNPRTTVKD